MSLKKGDRVRITVDEPEFILKTKGELGTVELVYDTGFALVRVSDYWAGTFLLSELEQLSPPTQPPSLESGMEE